MGRRLAPLPLLVLAALAGCGSSRSGPRTSRPATVPIRSSGPSPVSVSPAAGTSRTQFTVRFRAPASNATNRVRGLWVSASGPAGRGCAATAIATAPAAGAWRSAVLRPRGTHGWCPGPYTGRVVMTAAPACRPGEVCPMSLIALPIGHFSFRVSGD